MVAHGREGRHVKVIIAGSRTVRSYQAVADAVAESGFSIIEVVSGHANGVDQTGETWAHANGISVKRFPADWDTHGRVAGPIRNTQMADYADALIAIRRGGASSVGTTDMIKKALKRGLRVYIKEVA